MGRVECCVSARQTDRSHSSGATHDMAKLQALQKVPNIRDLASACSLIIPGVLASLRLLDRHRGMHAAPMHAEGIA